MANSMRLMCLGVHVPETQAAVLALGPVNSAIAGIRGPLHRVLAFLKRPPRPLPVSSRSSAPAAIAWSAGPASAAPTFRSARLDAFPAWATGRIKTDKPDAERLARRGRGRAVVSLARLVAT